MARTNRVNPGFKESMNELIRVIEYSEHIVFLLEKLQELEEKGFGPEPSIHSEGAIRFQKEILSANDWVLDILNNGLSLAKGAKLPKEYYEKNNQSEGREPTDEPANKRAKPNWEDDPVNQAWLS